MSRFPCAVSAIALSLASSGCSFLFTDAPPDRHETMVYFDCTSTPGPEVADGLFALLSVAGGADTLSQGEAQFKRENDGANRNTTATFQFVTGAVFAGSAVYGIIVTENCNDAKEDLRQRIIERERNRGRVSPPVPAAAPPAPVPPPPAAGPPAPAPTGETPPPPAAAPPPSPASAAPGAAPWVPPPAPAPSPRP